MARKRGPDRPPVFKTAPPCFSAGEWAAYTSCGYSNNRPCRDCSPAMQRKHMQAGTCSAPEVMFVWRPRVRFAREELLGVTAGEVKTTDKPAYLTDNTLTGYRPLQGPATPPKLERGH